MPNKKINLNLSQLLYSDTTNTAKYLMKHQQKFNLNFVIIVTFRSHKHLRIFDETPTYYDSLSVMFCFYDNIFASIRLKHIKIIRKMYINKKKKQDVAIRFLNKMCCVCVKDGSKY